MDRNQYTRKNKPDVSAAQALGDRLRAASLAYSLQPPSAVVSDNGPSPEPQSSTAKRRPKKVTYGRAAAAVARFIGSPRGNHLPAAVVLAGSVRRFEDKPTGVSGKGDAKQVVWEFYQRVVLKKTDGSVVLLQRPAPVKPEITRAGFYWSDEWRAVRYSALRASRGVCELCGAAPAKGSPLHVDHIKPRSRYPELELDPKNLQVLCQDCNLGKSNTDSIDWRRPTLTVTESDAAATKQ